MTVFFLFVSMIAVQQTQQTGSPAGNIAAEIAARNARIDHAVGLIHQQKYELAYQELDLLVKDDPTDARSKAFLAAMELQTGRLIDCQRHVEELTAKEPDNPDLRELHGQLYMARREWNNAEVEWRGIIKDRPNSEQAYMQLAAVLLQQDRYADALAAVSKSLDINPKRSDARSLRGNILASLGRMDEAALDWNISLVTDPDDTVALAGLAVYLRLTDPNHALEYAKRAYDLTGGKTMGPIRVLALIYRSRNDIEKAKQVLEKALLTYPNNEMLTAELNSLRNPAAAAARATPPPALPRNSGTLAPTTTLPPASVGAPPKSASAPVVAHAAAPVPVIAPPAKPVELESGLKISQFALGGLTIGADFSDMLVFIRAPRPPAPPVEAALAPRNAANKPVITVAAPKTATPVTLPDPELYWGKLPLSSISPAFVYAGVVAPPGASDAPTSLGEAARRLREKKKP